LGKSRWEQSDGTGLKRARQQGTGGFSHLKNKERKKETAREPLHQLHCPNGEFIHIDALYETDI
jgi:hypothetical protein